MKTKAVKTYASTQKFTQIKDIVDDIVLLDSWHACLCLEIASINFALLSAQEQDAHIFAYASFLNSLTFPIQILINNQKVDISAYLTLLEKEILTVKNTSVQNYMQQYKTFVGQLVKENFVLDKHFYIIVNYSYLEAGAMKTVSTKTRHTEDFFASAKVALHTKADGIKSQLGRMNLPVRTLQTQELTALFHSFYNAEQASNIHTQTAVHEAV